MRRRLSAGERTRLEPAALKPVELTRTARRLNTAPVIDAAQRSSSILAATSRDDTPVDTGGYLEGRHAVDRPAWPLELVVAGSSPVPRAQVVILTWDGLESVRSPHRDHETPNGGPE
jgi:hypothetical protein